MEITISMACSINGIIADAYGKEDFLSHENWKYFIKSLCDYDVLVYGKKTYDKVINRGEEYKNDLERNKIMVFNSKISGYKNNVYYFNSIESFLKHCKENNYKKVMLSGGATTNSFFLKNEIVDYIILYYNPCIVGKGINLFHSIDYEKGLKLIKVEKFESGIIKILYSI